jgi:DNA-binding beta-propeller fold protein YncE
MKKTLSVLLATAATLVSSCEWLDEHHSNHERLTIFTKVDDLALAGGETAAEISAYDPETKKLFVVNAVKSAIDVIDSSNPFDLVYETEISITPYGAGVNSVSVKNGLLAAVIESSPKTDPGKVVVIKTKDLSLVSVVPVGALPDMVTFSPNGRYILSANEGEPNEDYTIDPNGSISIIKVPEFSVVNLDFTAFASQLAGLKTRGFRTPGPVGTTFAQDVEPEYVAVSDDSRTAWITLQENNSVARVDLQSSRIEAILPLGFQDHSLAQNALDASDRDNVIEFKNWPVKGMYLPDGIAAFRQGGRHLFVTANEGDSRIRPTSDDALPPLEEGDLFNEELRIGSATLDPTKFPTATDLIKNTDLGRLKITNTMGDTDGDGDFDELYSFGSRSFTIRDGATGRIVFESGNQLEGYLLKHGYSSYDDARSDDKGAEPESVVIGNVGPRTLAFVALERSDAVVVVDVTNPASPVFRQILPTGDAPEGVLFVPAHESPNRRSLLVTSCEGDGTIQVFQLSREENEL